MVTYSKVCDQLTRNTDNPHSVSRFVKEVLSWGTEVNQRFIWVKEFNYIYRGLVVNTFEHRRKHFVLNAIFDARPMRMNQRWSDMLEAFVRRRAGHSEVLR